MRIRARRRAGSAPYASGTLCPDKPTRGGGRQAMLIEGGRSFSTVTGKPDAMARGIRLPAWWTGLQEREACRITPPDAMFLDSSGLTLSYPADRLLTLDQPEWNANAVKDLECLSFLAG
jgi:hypothetical protein